MSETRPLRRLGTYPLLPLTLVTQSSTHPFLITRLTSPYLSVVGEIRSGHRCDWGRTRVIMGSGLQEVNLKGFLN